MLQAPSTRRGTPDSAAPTEDRADEPADAGVALAPAVPLLHIVRRLGPALRPYRWQVVALVLLAAALPAIQVAEIWLFQRVVDDVLVPQDLQPMLGIALLYTAFSLASGGLSWLDDVLSTWVGEHLALDLRQRVLAHLHRVPTEVADRRRAGDLLTRLTGDVRAVESLLLGTAVDTVGICARLLFLGGTLLVLDWQLALVSFLVAPLLWAAAQGFARRIRRVSREARRRAGSMSAVAEESLSVLGLVQVHGREREEQQRFAREGRAILSAEVSTARISSTYPVVVDLVELLGLLAAIALGTWALAEERLTLGGLIVFLTCLGQLYKPVRELADLVTEVAAAAAGAERVLEVLDLPQGVQDRPDAQTPARVHGVLAAREVHFAWTAARHRPVLHGVSARFEPGELVAVVGPSGSGKSTLLRLLARLTDPSAGAVTLDGTDLRDLPLRVVRDHVVLLLQEAPVLDASVRDNVAFAAPGASEAQVWQALQAAEAAELVSALPGGLDARLGQRGRSLSGGQRQRIALARALLLPAPVLLLDEPTTGLDEPTARRLLATLRRISRDRTVVVASHDPVVRQLADRVVQLG